MNTTFKNILYLLNKFILKHISFELWHHFLFLFNSIRRKSKFYKLNFIKPKTFNEKILFLKRKKNNNLFSIVADKFLVRDYVSSRIGERYLIPLIWSSSNLDDLTFEKIKMNSVVKLNNGSGNNYIINEQPSKLEFEKMKASLANNFHKDFSLFSREMHYKNISPRILIENLLDYPLNDYKIFCSNGEPFMIQVDVDRFTNHTRSFYNLNWEKQEIILNYKTYPKKLNRPKNLNLMTSIAKQLSADFEFCRIDLYDSNDKVYFGEITLFPGGGVELFENYSMDFDMGKYIVLNDND
jgi:hypothetical protein